jgi:superfamily II DNA or RNA helicase
MEQFPDGWITDLQALIDPPSFVDLLEPMAPPGSDGSIFVKRVETERLAGQRRDTTRVEPPGLRDRMAARHPSGLDIFELLLPILMPPATAEFRGELLFPAELYGYQRAGVKWLVDTPGALLADDMGLGKTAQAITAFRALVRRGDALKALVICPKSVLTNWLRETQRWAPELVAVKIEGGSPDRKAAWLGYVGKCHMLLVTYDTLLRDIDYVNFHNFDLIIADEVQRIKNAGTATARAVCSIDSARHWGLSGTPLENRIDDIVAVFRFIRPGLFSVFEMANCGTLSASGVRERIGPYILRRRKEEALPELPPHVVDTKWLELGPGQRTTYDRVVQTRVSALKARGDVTVQHIFALIAELKQLCNFDPTTSESAKLEFLDDYLQEACSQGQKALVVSQYVDEGLERIAAHLGEVYKPLVYSGRLSSAARDAVVRAFTDDEDHRVLLLSLRAGGVGINLSRANYVLHFDRWWNPAVEKQAGARAHRIGQTRTVFETHLICQDTVEEKIERILHEKKVLFSQVVDELADMKLEKALSEEELFGLFGLKPPPRSQRQPGHTRPASDEGKVGLSQAKVIQPDTPFSNRSALREVLRNAEEYIWWADLHFASRGLEELSETMNPAAVRRVRILSGPANVTERAARDFELFAKEMGSKGVTAQWRILERFGHDRYILSANACYNVPPINTILAPASNYSEILSTPNRPPFDQWWSQGQSIELIFGSKR